MARTWLLAGIVAAAGCGPDPEAGTTRMDELPSAGDLFGEPIALRGNAGGQPGYVPPINVSLLPDGDVLVYGGYFRFEYESMDDGNYDQLPWAGKLRPDGAAGEATLDDVAAGIPFDYPFVQTETNELGETWAAYDALFCTGGTLTRHGDVFVAGGTLSVRRLPDPAQVLHVVGLNAAFSFDTYSSSWRRHPDMTGEIPAWAPLAGNLFVGRPLGAPSRRWYPTAIRLADSRLLVAGGSSIWSVPQEAVPFPPGQDLRNMAVELYDPSIDDWQVVSWHPQDARGDDPGTPCVEFPKTPETAWGGLYPHVFQLPEPIGGYDVLFLGDSATPTLFAPGGCAPWVVYGGARPGEERGDRRVTASSVLLPLRVADGVLGYHNGSVLVVGGPEGSSYQSRIDGYDPITNAWGTVADMGVVRSHTSAVLLPDGRVLVLGGVGGGPQPLQGMAQYVDPLSGFELGNGQAYAPDPLNPALPEQRGYHTVDLLLPDGRVLHGGGRHDGYLERATIRLYSPPYVFQARPRIEQAPDTIHFGEVVRVHWSGVEGMRVVDAAVMGLGSMTHSFDMNQRHVQLAVVGEGIDDAGAFVDLVGPPNGRWAPPGPYMLFLLDTNRVPSPASFVTVEEPGQ